MVINTLSIIFIILSAGLLVGLSISIYSLKLKKTETKTLDEKLIDQKEKLTELSITLSKTTESLALKNKDLEHLLKLELDEEKLKENVQRLTDEFKILNQKLVLTKKNKEDLENDLESTKRDLSIFYPQLDLINLGFFEEPVYFFQTSDRFKEEIKIIRENQKSMIKDNNAIIIPDRIALTDNQQLAKKALQGQVDLMLRAFNIDCDNLIADIKPSNYPLILERIDKVATSIEKSSLSLGCGFNEEFTKLKFKECEHVYQYTLKKQREKEEQDRINEQMREEEKARREYERAIAKAEREEEIFQNALEEAKKQLELANDDEKDKLNTRINVLQIQLLEAQVKNQRAKSMAEQTRRGHVYVISNIGSFGENIYKIGLTRRLEPLDRVKELGDASVPFSFDVHAMIYSEDAPALEKALHNKFGLTRVNQVNYRKEFFEIDLLEIKKEVDLVTNNTADFTITALAEEFHQSLSLKGNFNN